jgi:hypothetical protein
MILNAIYLKATSETLEILENADDDQMPASEALRRNAELQLIARDLDQAAVYFQEAPFIEEWLSAEQVSEIRGRERRFERGILSPDSPERSR